MTSVQILNVIACLAVAVVAIVGYGVATRPAALLRAATRRAEWTGLPFGSADIVDALVARMRTLALATSAAGGATTLLAAAVALGPLGRERGYFLGVLAALFATTGVATTIVAVRRQLFRPTTGAPRVARVSGRRISDYFGPFRRGLPFVATGAAAAWAAVLVVRGEAAPADVTVVALACCGLAAVPAIDRAVLAAPQAASHSLELSWDDAFRAEALGAARATICLVAMAGVLIALPPTGSWGLVLLNLAMTAVILAYARAPLASALRPPWLVADTAGPR